MLWGTTGQAHATDATVATDKPVACMAKMTETNTTTITIPSELRDRLRSRKIGNDTYSDVIERLLADTDE
jgi:hypothetical protein